jgi:2,3-bisphosphoglycerate-independent phosphoglycerate mutase
VVHLNLIYVIIDGLGDRPVEELGNKTPLEAAATPNMDLLAKKGETGMMYTVGKGIAPESDVGVISILGYNPFKYHTGRGPLEALGSEVHMNDGDLALRCNFATLGSGNKIVDRRAGRNLTVEEATELSKVINDGVKFESYPANFEFKNTIGHRGVLVIRSERKPLSGNITNTDPAYSRVEGLGVAEVDVEMTLKRCTPLEETEKAIISAKLVNEFTQKSYLVLDKHDVNEKRVTQGKLKANLILTRDAGHLVPKFFNINERYGVRFTCLADMPVERGIAKLAGMHMVALPPPSEDIERDYVHRAEKVRHLLPQYNCLYLHIKGPDVPSHDGNPHLKKRLITAIDKYLFGKLLPKIKMEDHIICITADHSTPCELKAHSDDPVPLLVSGNKIEGDNVHKFSEKECRKGSLGILESGIELMPKLIACLKG